MKKTIVCIDEFTSLSTNDIYCISKIEWWLLKYEPEYLTAKSLIDALQFDSIFYQSSGGHQEEFQIIDLFEKLLEMSDCHKNEIYFKEQLVTYNELKNDVGELNNWLETHYLDIDGQQSKFNMLFADNRELRDYNFVIQLRSSHNFILEKDDFKYSIQFLNLIERSKKVMVKGVVIQMDNIELFEESRITKGNSIISSPAYKRQKIVLATNDKHLNEHLIKFLKGKTELLENVSIGQRIKVYADLRGGNWKNESGKMEYQNSLLGWDVEVCE